MPFKLQSSFTQGEIGDKMLARVDFEGYFKGAKRLRNVLVLPQGGAQRRFGLEYVATLNAGITDDDEVKALILEYKDSTFYVLIIRPLAIDIFYDDALVTTVVTPYAAAEVTDIQFEQTASSVIFVHPSYTPRHLIRTSAHAGWSLTTPTFKNVPGWDFDRNYDAITFSLQDSVGAAFVVGNNQVGTGVRFIAGAAFFTAAMVGGRAFFAGGVIRYTAFSSNTRMDGEIQAVFDTKFDGTLNFNPTGFSGKDLISTEPAFSDARGWPSHIVVYQNRVCLGNTTELPNVSFQSALDGFYNDEFDFDDSSTDATAAFSSAATGNNGDAIRALFSGQSLMAFTKGSEYSTSILVDKGFSFENGGFTLQGNDGMKANVYIVNIDGKIVFAHDGGKIISGMTYSTEEQRYKARNISLLASHLIRNPVDMGAYRNPDNIDGQFLFVVNGDDGTLAVLQIIEDQNILAWSLSTTPGGSGEFIRIASAGNKAYFVTKRTINSVTSYYLEKLNFSLRTDCALTGTNAPASVTVSGLSHLEGEEVKIIASDGNKIYGTKTVTAGVVTLDEEITNYEVGINFTTEIVPMPLVITTQAGADPYSNIHVNTLYVDYYESLGIVAAGTNIPFREFGGTDAFDPELKSGIYAVTPTKGWSPRQEFIISQEEPYFMTIRGVGYEVDQTLEAAR